jgi:hypothetical protein
LPGLPAPLCSGFTDTADPRFALARRFVLIPVLAMLPWFPAVVYLRRFAVCFFGFGFGAGFFFFFFGGFFFPGLVGFTGFVSCFG